MRSSQFLGQNVREGLADALEWRLLGLLVERPHGEWKEQVAALARETTNPLLLSAADAARQASEGLYLALLGPGGPVSPREAAHCTGQDPGKMLADVAAFYRAFAYRPAAEDPPDHIAVELGFAGYLRLKETFAESAGDCVKAATAREARNGFIACHLGPLARTIAHRLRAWESGYLELAAKALVARFGEASEAEVNPRFIRPGGQFPMLAGRDDAAELEGECGIGCSLE